MDNEDLALFGGKPRKQRGERQLTEALVALCAKDPALRIGLGRALLAVLGTKHAASVAARLPVDGKTVTVEAEKTLGTVNTKWLREAGGRPDIVIHTDDVLIVVEAKVAAGLGEKQLQRYLNHPDFASGARTGGLAVISETPVPVPRRVGSNRRWLGQASWRQLIPELEKVQARNAEVQQQWLELLDVIQLPGDLGDGLVTWNRGKRTLGQRNRLVLRAVERSAAEALGNAVKSRFTDPPKMECLSTVHRAHDDQVQMHMRLKRTATSPAVVVTVWGKRRPLHVEVFIPHVTVATGRPGRRHAAEEHLMRAGFTQAEGGFRADARFGTVEAGGETTPQVALRQALEHLLAAAGESGALDGHVDRLGRKALA